MESWKYMKWFSGNKSADSYRTKEDNRAFYRDMFKIALPVALQNIISYSVNLTDTVMLASWGKLPCQQLLWPTRYFLSLQLSALAYREVRWSFPANIGGNGMLRLYRR